MLTGESIPVTKQPLPDLSDKVYDTKSCEINTLFSGTKVIQTRSFSRGYVSALVIRTNFNILKGLFIKSILHPKPNRIDFQDNGRKFIFLTSIMAIAGFVYTLPYLVEHLSITKIIIRSMDLINIAVPPCLSTYMSASVVFAVSRLKKKHIMCTSPPIINVAGKVKTVVFDKTGTLTEDSLRFHGISINLDNKLTSM